MRLSRIINKLALISNPLIWLRDYLTMSDANKGRELAYTYNRNFIEWYAHVYSDVDPDEEFSIVDTLQEAYEENYEDAFNDIPDEAFERYLEDEAFQISSGDPLAPSFLYMSFENIITNQWLIHFTDNAGDISVDGFEYGYHDYAALGLTTGLTQEAKEMGGYNFAYDIYDFVRYGRDRHGSGWKYGNEAVVFRASGIKVTHWGDEEPQVIFWGGSANQIVPLYESDGTWHVGSRPSGESIYHTDDLDAMVTWVTENYDQYKRVL